MDLAASAEPSVAARSYARRAPAMSPTATAESPRWSKNRTVAAGSAVDVEVGAAAAEDGSGRAVGRTLLAVPTFGGATAGSGSACAWGRTAPVLSPSGGDAAGGGAAGTTALV